MKDFQRSITKENTLNEYKGVLFEYLLGVQAARYYRIEGRFIESLDKNHQDTLRQYESYIRSYDISLWKILPYLALQTWSSLKKSISTTKIKNILLVGRSHSAFVDMDFKEADLLFLGENHSIPISLKLCKLNSFINTKNAGVQSFIEKYFPFEDSFAHQEALNNLLQASFQEMGQKLYEMASLQFNKRFDNQWTKAGYSHLPGELPKAMREIILDYYSKIIMEIHHRLEDFYQRNEKIFVKSIYNLCGFSSPQIIQVNCFHGGKGHPFKSVRIINRQNSLDLFSKLEIKPYEGQLSSFEIKFDKAILQIRVKPMNKFIVPGLKVNCSLKHLPD